MPHIPADTKKGFYLVIGALIALWVASLVQNRIG